MRKVHQKNFSDLNLTDAQRMSSPIVSAEFNVSPSSKFSDPKWDMTELVTTPGISKYQTNWDFSRSPGFPSGFALSLAEFAYSRLYKPVTTHDRTAVWLTVHNELFVLNSFAKFCSEEGIFGFHEVDNLLLDRYLKLVSIQESKSYDRVRNIFGCIYKFWEYRGEISESIPIFPFGRSFNKMFPNRRDSSNIANKTPVIPEQIYSSMMGAALDYVLKYSEDLLNSWADLQNVWDVEIGPLNLTMSTKYKRLANFAFKSHQNYNSHWRKQPLLTFGDLYAELYQLRIACMLVIICYSGIRPSELLSLKAGCYVTDQGEDGQTIYYINTVLHKHVPGGRKDSWVVIEEVVTAIKILEVLTQRMRSAANDDRLFLSDRSGSFCCVQKDFVGVDLHEYGNSSLIYQVNVFRDHCNSNLAREPIPEWINDSGVKKPWPFNIRQFRRTLARYIARQPFGIIAGMLQYKHVHVAIFEGYAGHEPEWNKLLEQEKVLASIDVLGELAIDLVQGGVAGEFGERLKSEIFTEFKGRAEDFPASQIAKWLSSKHKQLFVGKFNFCFFDSSKALCTVNESIKDKPVLNFCEPTKCSNACVGRRHKPIWEAQLNQAIEFVQNSKTSELQREALQDEVNELKKVIQLIRKDD